MDNKKANIIRATFWGIIALIVLILGIMGAIYNNRIFSSRKNELENITILFNNSKFIKNYDTIGTKIYSELKGKNIIVKYESIEEKEYIFKLKNGYLETNIEKNDTIGKIIAMVITDSIAVNKGNIEGNTYPLFNDNTILNYKLNEGIEYNIKNNKYNIKINLDKYLTLPLDYNAGNDPNDEIIEDNTTINNDLENERAIN